MITLYVKGKELFSYPEKGTSKATFKGSLLRPSNPAARRALSSILKTNKLGNALVTVAWEDSGAYVQQVCSPTMVPLLTVRVESSGEWNAYTSAIPGLSISSAEAVVFPNDPHAEASYARWAGALGF